MSGSISTPGAVNTYQLACSAGQSVQVEMTGLGENSVRPALHIYDPEGNLMEVKQCQQGTSGVAKLAIEQDGPCTILASSGSYLDNGPYTLKASVLAG